MRRVLDYCEPLSHRQGSKGYAKLSQLSRIGYNPDLAPWENQRGSDERAAAARLLARRRREIRLEW